MSSASKYSSPSDDSDHWSRQPPRVFSRDDVIASVSVATVATASEYGDGADPGGPDDTVAEVLLQTTSRFDIELLDAWKRARDAGALNYLVDDVLTKTLPGKYGIVLQLNPCRRSNRRAPMKYTKLHHPFDASAFNFNKINSHELLFNLELPGADGTTLRGSVIVNTAPLCTSHCLLLPSPQDCCPQLINDAGLQFAVTTVLLSGVRSFHVGFNSLCAYASVNHCHFHAYYLGRRLNVETAECRQLRGQCYAIVGHYAPGFVFQATADDVQQSVSSVMKLVNHLSSAGIPHNVFITRGLPVAQNDSESNIDPGTVPNASPGEGEACTLGVDQFPPGHDVRRPIVDTKTRHSYEVLRICVWARKSSAENCSDNTAEFYAAVCELSGHVPVYSSDVWGNVEEETITREVSQACVSTFNALLPTIEQLYS